MDFSPIATSGEVGAEIVTGGAGVQIQKPAKKTKKIMYITFLAANWSFLSYKKLFSTKYLLKKINKLYFFSSCFSKMIHRFTIGTLQHVICVPDSIRVKFCARRAQAQISC